jgi:hypothetical protein
VSQTREYAREEPAPYPALSSTPGPGPVPPATEDHDHAATSGHGGNIPPSSVTGTAVTLSGDQTITGLKTLTGNDSETVLTLNSHDNMPAATLRVVPTASPGAISLPKSDQGETTTLLGVYASPGYTPLAGNILTGTATADGHVGYLDAPTAHQILAGNDAGTLPEWVAAEDIGIATEEYVNAAVAQVINVASGSTLTVGTQTSGTYASTNVHDSTPWRVREAAATPGLNVELTFSSIPSAPTALWLRAYHNGQHTITVSIYKYTTSAWESYQVLPSAQSGYTFYSIPIPDGSDHISAGAARVQFAYTGEGSLDDYLYVDYCALVKGGQGSEKVDAARTWATKQTFPADGVTGSCPRFVGDSSGPEKSFEIVDNAGGAPHTLGVVGDALSGNLICIMKPGAMVSSDSTGTLALLGAGLLKNSGATGNLSIAAAADLPAHTHTEDAIQVSATDKLVGRSSSGAGACEEIACTAAGRALLDDTAASDQRTTLGLGAAALWTALPDHDHTGDAGDGGAIYPRVVASVTLNNLSADTSTTADLLATAPAGWYRYTVYVRVSTAGAAGDVLQCSVKWRDGGNRTSLLDSIQSFSNFYFGTVADPSYIDLSSSVVHSSSSYMFYHESATYDIHYCVLFPVKTGSPVVQFKGVLERVT